MLHTFRVFLQSAYNKLSDTPLILSISSVSGMSWQSVNATKYHISTIYKLDIATTKKYIIACAF